MGYQVELSIRFIDDDDDDDDTGSKVSSGGCGGGGTSRSSCHGRSDCRIPHTHHEGHDNNSWEGEQSSSVVVMTIPDNNGLLQRMEGRVDGVEAFMRGHFDGATVRERRDGKLRMEIPLSSGNLSTIFATIEQHRKEVFIEDYSVCQTSLEMIFNHFAATAVYKGPKGWEWP